MAGADLFTQKGNVLRDAENTSVSKGDGVKPGEKVANSEARGTGGLPGVKGGVGKSAGDEDNNPADADDLAPHVAELKKAAAAGDKEAMDLLAKLGIGAAGAGLVGAGLLAARRRAAGLKDTGSDIGLDGKPKFNNPEDIVGDPRFNYPGENNPPALIPGENARTIDTAAPHTGGPAASPRTVITPAPDKQLYLPAPAKQLTGPSSGPIRGGAPAPQALLTDQGAKGRQVDAAYLARDTQDSSQAAKAAIAMAAQAKGYRVSPLTRAASAIRNVVR